MGWYEMISRGYQYFVQYVVTMSILEQCGNEQQIGTINLFQ